MTPDAMFEDRARHLRRVYRQTNPDQRLNERGFLVIDPCIPPEWPGYEARLRVGDTRYDIRVAAPSQSCKGVSSALLDGAAWPVCGEQMRVPLDGASHILHFVMK